MKLIVLLSTYNGEKYIRQQLDSLIAQSLPNVEILGRDDGSKDGTCEILEEYAKRGVLCWYAGRNLGPARSFWQLLRDAPEADYYAFCDQDDVWDADKLEVAVSALSQIETAIPALYCGDVRVTDEQLRVLSESMVQPMQTDYAHALVQNLAPGCTYVFNRTARELLCRYDTMCYGLELHDWTTYQIVACFGRVVYDSAPHMSYRQHGGNVIGANQTTARAWLEKAASFWSGAMKNSREREALRLERVYGDRMSPENLALTQWFAHYRENRSFRLQLLRGDDLGLYGLYGVLFRLLVLFGRL